MLFSVPSFLTSLLFLFHWVSPSCSLVMKCMCSDWWLKVDLYDQSPSKFNVKVAGFWVLQDLFLFQPTSRSHVNRGMLWCNLACFVFIKCYYSIKFCVLSCNWSFWPWDEKCYPYMTIYLELFLSFSGYYANIETCLLKLLFEWVCFLLL